MKLYPLSVPLFAAAVLLSSCATQTQPAKPLKTAAKVDLKRYSGTWFEIARYPKWFQSGCNSAKAEYSPKKDGTIKVVNICLRGDGSSSSIEGVAKPVDAKANRLQVSFPNNWYTKAIPVAKEGNYWIIDVSPDYRRAIVGTPDRRSLWFLSRSPVIATKDFEEMKATATAQGFDMSNLRIDGHTKIESRGRVAKPAASPAPATPAKPAPVKSSPAKTAPAKSTPARPASARPEKTSH